jgi:hypothetical protein
VRFLTARLRTSGDRAVKNRTYAIGTLLNLMTLTKMSSPLKAIVKDTIIVKDVVHQVKWKTQQKGQR